MWSIWTPIRRRGSEIHSWDLIHSCETHINSENLNKYKTSRYLEQFATTIHSPKRRDVYEHQKRKKGSVLTFPVLGKRDGIGRAAADCTMEPGNEENPPTEPGNNENCELPEIPSPSFSPSPCCSPMAPSPLSPAALSAMARPTTSSSSMPTKFFKLTAKFHKLAAS